VNVDGTEVIASNHKRHKPSSKSSKSIVAASHFFIALTELDSLGVDLIAARLVDLVSLELLVDGTSCASTGCLQMRIYSFHCLGKEKIEESSCITR